LHEVGRDEVGPLLLTVRRAKDAMRRLVARLARTSADEFIHRGTERLFLAGERVRYAAGLERWDRAALGRRLAATPGTRDLRDALAARQWSTAESLLRDHFASRPPRFVIDSRRKNDLAGAIHRRFPQAASAADHRARSVLNGRLELLGYRDLPCQIREDIDWQADPVSGRRAPLAFWGRVPFLDPAVGDHKVIWELNRHQHWLALGRAAWLAGGSEYGTRVSTELRSWLRANPPLGGINWASMLELALRSISWVWALHFFNDIEDGVDPDTPPWRIELLLGLDRQLRHVERHLSTYFSPNTHLLGEGLALYVAGRVLPELKSALRWEGTGRQILVNEAHAQVNADGGHVERSAHYHRYALDFYLLALSVARVTGDRFAGLFAEVSTGLGRFCRAIADDSGRLPMLGDDDGGLLFPICGRDPIDASDSLALAASLLGRPEFAVGPPPEEVFWMLGGDPPLSQQSPGHDHPGTRVYADTGYIVIRSPGGHAILDAGTHGFLNGGHAHADALNLVLSVGGRPLFIDPGTATYTMDAEIRDRFRSSAMHNTVEVDGRAQSEPAGPFHWRSRTDAHPGLWRSTARFDFAEGWHTGYAPAIHRRVVLRTSGLWTIIDHVIDGARHGVQAHWHIDPSWDVERESRSAVALRHRDGPMAAIASTARRRDLLHGDPQGVGWCAPRYGRVVPSLTIRLVDDGGGPITLTTVVADGAAPWPLTVDGLPVSAERDDEWHRAAVLVRQAAASTIVLSAAPPGGARPPRSLQRVAIDDDGAELVTDALAAVLVLSAAGQPRELHVLDATIVIWKGTHTFDLPAAGDLHLDETALCRLSRAQ
jgi:hypothetical protein